MSVTFDLLKSKHMGVREFKNHLCRVLREESKPVVITERGNPAKVLLSYDDMVELLEFFEELLDPNTRRNVREGLIALRGGIRGVSFADTYKEFHSKSKLKKK